MLKKTFVLFLICITMFSCVSVAYADTDAEIVGSGVATDGKTSTVQTQTSSATTTEKTTQSDPYAVSDINSLIGIPDVSTDDIVNKITDKGNDVITIVQTVGRAVCIVVFLICCVCSLIGLLGNQRMLTGSIIGLALSGIMYAAITCGREIVQVISAWAQS